MEPSPVAQKKKTKTKKKVPVAVKKATKKKAKSSAPVEVPDDDAITPEVVDVADDGIEISDEELLLETPEKSTALAPTDAMGRYMAEISKYPVLSREEEHALAVRYKETGDPKAAEALVTANLRFVVKVAAEYTKFGSKLIDLVQEGNVGLMHAVKDFNPYKGVRLITYAVWWIRGYIQEYLMRQYSMVRIGTTANQRKLFYQLQKQRQELEKLGYREGLAQLSGRLGISEEEIQIMQQRLSGRDLSLDQPMPQSEGTTTLMDFHGELNGDTMVDALGTAEEIQMLKQKIEEIRPELNERELELLDQRLLTDTPITLQEIGEKHGVSREAVRQMEARLMKKIKDALETELRDRLTAEVIDED
jgi:RNA polymerase sigma-32 factor